MNFDPQRQVAAALPGATEDIKWGADLVSSVGPARAKWVQVKAGHVLGTPALNDLMRRSHALVLSRLTKKLQRELSP